MDQAIAVALVRSDDRRGAVAQALALIADPLRAQVTPSVMVVPQPSCHADTLAATLDALLHAGAVEALIVESRATAERLGHSREVFGRPVRFVDPDDAETNDLLAAAADVACSVSLLRATKRAWRRPVADRFPAHAPTGAGQNRVSRNVVVVDAFDLKRSAIAGTDPRAVAAIATIELEGRRAPGAEHIRVLGDPVYPAGVVHTPRWHVRLRRRAQQHDHVA